MTEKNTKGWLVRTPTQELFDEVREFSNGNTNMISCDYWCSYKEDTYLRYDYEADWLYFGSVAPIYRVYGSYKDTEITIEQFREMYGKKEEAVEQGETHFSAETNPKASIGSQALPMSMCSPLFAAHVALGKYNGMLKYGGSNYIGTEVVMSIYLDAIQRHLDKIKMGEVVDEVDGVNHFGAIGANCDIILSAQAAGTLIDDRLRSDGQLEAYKALTPMVKGLQELHKDKNPKHYYAKDKK